MRHLVSPNILDWDFVASAPHLKRAETPPVTATLVSRSWEPGDVEPYRTDNCRND